MTDRSLLTDRQRQIFEFINERIRTVGYPPTIREIGEHLGIRSTNGVADHLKALKRKGYLQQDGSKSRTWQPLKEAGSASPPSMAMVPMLGRVAAGEPILALEEAELYVHVDRQLIGAHQGLFALKVMGDSMIEAGILSGDTVFVNRQSQASAGEIVVALIDQEVTVKKYYPEEGQVRFQPANAKLQPIIIKPDEGRTVAIIGVVVGVYRKY